MFVGGTHILRFDAVIALMLVHETYKHDVDDDGKPFCSKPSHLFMFFGYLSCTGSSKSVRSVFEWFNFDQIDNLPVSIWKRYIFRQISMCDILTNFKSHYFKIWPIWYMYFKVRNSTTYQFFKQNCLKMHIITIFK